MKTQLKYFLIGLAIALLGINTPAGAINSVPTNKAGPNPSDIPAIVQPWSVCLHFPHSKKDAENPENVSIMNEVAILARKNIPLELLKKETVVVIFFEAGENLSLLCFYDPPAE